MPEYLFELLTGAVGFFGATFITGLSKKQAAVEEKVNNIPNLYVRKEDYRADMTEVKDDLKEVLRLLNEKEDRKR